MQMKSPTVVAAAAVLAAATGAGAMVVPVHTGPVFAPTPTAGANSTAGVTATAPFKNVTVAGGTPNTTSLNSTALNSTTTLKSGGFTIPIPNALLNNASKTLDYVNAQLISLGLKLNSIIGNSPPKVSPQTAQQAVDMLRAPLFSQVLVLEAATRTAKSLGITFRTPADLKETASDPTCDGTCLLLKVNKIMTEITTFNNVVAQRTGLEAVTALMKPVNDAATALVIQLDGDLHPSSSSVVVKLV